MRDTEAGVWMLQDPLRRGLRLAVVVLSVAVVMTVGAARAQDDDDEDDKTFEEKIIGNIMAGIGGTNMESRGIEYRERSPLVVPPKLDLPPPESVKSEIKDPNWPKDPDEARRKAAIAARKKNNPKSLAEAARPLTPDELNAGRTAAPARTNNDPVQPGSSNNPMLSPAQLGYTGGLFNLFKGNNKSGVGPVHGRTGTGNPDPAAGRVSDAVAEFRLRHRTELPETDRHTCRRDDGQRGP